MLRYIFTPEFEVLDSIVNCLKEYESNSDEWDDCNTMHKEYNKTMNDFNDEVLKSLDSWFNQPKVHGDEYEDYVLVPLCSFAEDHLEKCDLFEPSKLKVQDQQCFTYDGKRNTNVGPSSGLKFLLNLQNIPHDKNDQPLSLDLYLHESGSYPDLVNVKTFPTTILASEQVVKIGVSITNREMTRNFKAMSTEKRKCIPSNAEKTYKSKKRGVKNIVNGL